MIANDGLLTPPEAAEFLAISERKLWDLTKAQKIKVTLIPPRSKRYHLADLLDFVNRCKGNGVLQAAVAPAGPAS